MSKMLLEILKILLFLELWCVKYIFFWFYQSVGFFFFIKKGITSAVECADETVFTFATRQMRAMVQ